MCGILYYSACVVAIIIIAFIVGCSGYEPFQYNFIFAVSVQIAYAGVIGFIFVGTADVRRVL